jgi:outer membrane receptor for ferrienterochelin and colicins
VKKLIGLVLICLWSSVSLAQHRYSFKVIDHENLLALPGASIHILELKNVGITDQNGTWIFDAIPTGTFTFEVRFIGFESQKFKRSFPSNSQGETISLYPDEKEMEAILIESTRSSRVISDIPTRVEVIAGEELAEKGNMKPGDIRMLLNESTGIQTQQTSATSYNSSIRIQGLDGKYTQLLRDGLPLYAGYSGGLSLMQIAPLDLAQVEVIKGSSSTLYGGGAIAGLVNLISKKPVENGGIDVLINGTSALGLDASGFYSEKFGKWGSTFFASYNKGTAYDPADIGLTAIPKFDRFTLNPKLFWNPDGRSELVVGVNWTKESRLGGNLDFIRGNEVTKPYFEKNQTDRVSTQLTYRQNLLEGLKLTLKNSFNFFNRETAIPDFEFGGKQVSSFSEVHLSKFGNRSDWVGGINLWTENFRQNAVNPDQVLDYKLNTFGAFIQNLWSISPAWTLESGFRVDTQKDYGIFALPKVSLMFEPNELLTFRMGGGLGYKTPTVFTEETERLTFRNVRPIDPSILDAERSVGTNLDMNYRISLGEELTFSTNVLFFFTQINNPLLLDFGGTFYTYRQPEGQLQTQGMEVNLKWGYRDLKLFVGYTLADVSQRTSQGRQVYPLVAKHRLNNVLMFEKHENFRVGFEAYYFSPQLLNDGATGQSYWILGLMTEKKLGDNFSVFLNFENFLDTRQTGFDTIFTGSISRPVFRDIYAPVDGFVINGGVKFHL